MARLVVYQLLDMFYQTTWIGEIIAATPKVIAISDGFRQGDYYGDFKYKNGDIASGTVTNYNYFEDGLNQYSVSGLKLNAKKVENLVMSGNAVGLMELAFQGNDIIDASLVVPHQDGVDGMWYVYDNTLYGFKGNDIIIGSNGDDLIVGGLGKDTLTGGYGSNSFYFDKNLGSSNVDTITDFVSGIGGDWLYLDKNIFKKLPSTSDSFNGNLADNLVIGTKALDANDYLIFNPTTHTLSYDADGSGAGKAVAFVVLTGVTAISADDIWAGNPYE